MRAVFSRAGGKIWTVKRDLNYASSGTKTRANDLTGPLTASALIVAATAIVSLWYLSTRSRPTYPSGTHESVIMPQTQNAATTTQNSDAKSNQDNTRFTSAVHAP